MDETRKPIFVELTIVQSSLVNAPSPRKGLVGLAAIASLEDLGDKTPLKTRCAVTLYEPDDTTVEDDTGEHAVRANRTLLVREPYAELVALLAEHAVVVRPK